MKILEIEIINNRAIKCFKSRLNGENLELAGGTGSGKTTAISALWEILEKRSDSLRHGEKSGHVRIKIGDGNKLIVATRKNTEKTSTITLMDSNGDQVSIKDFKRMISELSVNPHKIMEMKPKEQVNVLLKSASLGDFDIAKVDADIAQLEADRLDAHRKVELIKPGPEEVERVDIADLLVQRDKATSVNSENEKRRNLLIDIKEEKRSAGVDLSELKRQLKLIQNQIIDDEAVILGLDERITKGETIITELADIDVGPITEQINNASQNNEQAAQHDIWVSGKEKHDTATAAYSGLDKQVRELRESKKAALNNAQWPIEGLSIVDGEVVYKECLLENLGDSEKMLVCAALAVEDIKSHPLKVVRMDGVESMSPEDFVSLKSLFNDQGIQVLSTRVSRGDVDDCEIVITDGEYGVEQETDGE